MCRVIGTTHDPVDLKEFIVYWVTFSTTLLCHEFKVVPNFALEVLINADLVKTTNGNSLIRRIIDNVCWLETKTFNTVNNCKQILMVNLQFSSILSIKSYNNAKLVLISAWTLWRLYLIATSPIRQTINKILKLQNFNLIK